MRNTDIELGQRFHTAAGSTWEVKRMLAPDPLPRHFVIVDIHDRKSSRLIAESALRARHLYEPVRAA